MDDRIEINVVKCIKFILSQLRSKIPIKRAAIISNALDSKTNFASIFNLAKDRLLNSYGLNIAELSPGVYIVHSILTFEPSFSYNKEQKREMLLLTLIIYLIRSKGGNVSEDVIFNQLEDFGIVVNREHPFFGANLKNVITKKFVKQLYINREKEEGVIIYSLGSRATIEFSNELLTANIKTITERIQSGRMCYE